MTHTQQVVGRQAEIVSVATELILADPERTPTVRDVAAACGLSPGAIYTHFRDFDQVLDGVVQAFTDIVIDSLDGAIAPFVHADVAERRRACARGFCRVVVDHKVFLQWSRHQPSDRMQAGARQFVDFFTEHFPIDPATAARMMQPCSALMVSLSVMANEDDGDGSFTVEQLETWFDSSLELMVRAYLPS